MSKNVAVFVDVANIFYAAKAAGVDIDYVTLLKAATAGRDFVRAYAYTGLDPENENQRQFHAFLARSGYKVISKDIRKYGDGRIKANLDIELVVDMMKTARNLDIAVIVSGDGDFAPAIRAVQEMGVRCEVISFRGNTSSDLIEVADQFTDIAQIARVEKGSARSGRRVAAEGDLSMTEVPEKETEGAPRRGRGRGRGREERVPAAAAAAAAAAADTANDNDNLIVLPGERLSRAGEAEAEAQPEPVELEEAAYAEGSGNGVDATSEDARRRRRRRGGRGRGRGRRPEDEALVASGEAVEPSGEVDEEFEELEELPAAQAPQHTFGSVWDSQLGVPTASMPPSVDLGGGATEDDEDFEEPEVPEYLLAERRQQGGQRPGGRGRPAGGGRNRGAYQVALDRERFGRGSGSGGGSPQPTFGGGGNRSDRGGRDRGRQGRPQQGGGRPVDRAARTPDRQPTEARSSSEPWSEVPPELEQMLRAELARKQPAAEPMTAEMQSTESVETPAETPAEAKPVRRRRTTKASAAAEVEATEAPAAKAAAPKRATRTRTTKKAAAETAPAEAAAEAEPESAPAEAAQDEPKKPVRRRRTTAAKTEEA